MKDYRITCGYQMKDCAHRLFLTCVMVWLIVEGSSVHNHAHASAPPKHIVLLGASVGKEWDIASLPARLPADGYTFEFVGAYRFDKTEALHMLLARKSMRPDAIILKECAAYFPGDLDEYRSLMQGWVAAARREGVVPIPATVAPVTRINDTRSYSSGRLKGIIKQYLLGIPTRMESIAAHNDWLRNVCRDRNLVMLDLEKTLRISGDDRHLREDMTGGDGLHLNQKAYRALDAIVIPALKQVLW